MANGAPRRDTQIGEWAGERSAYGCRAARRDARGVNRAALPRDPQKGGHGKAPPDRHRRVEPALGGREHDAIIATAGSFAPAPPDGGDSLRRDGHDHAAVDRTLGRTLIVRHVELAGGVGAGLVDVVDAVDPAVAAAPALRA